MRSRAWSLGVVACAVLLHAGAAAAASRGSGTIRSEVREVGPFRELQVSGGLEVVFRQAPQPSVRIEADDNLLSLVSTRVERERLIIEVTSRFGVHPTRPIRAVVAAPVLDKLQASGGVRATIESGAGRELELRLSGGVELSAAGLDADRLDVVGSGGVELTLAGRAKAVEWELSGGVSVRAKELQAQRVTLEASGGCTLELAAAESVTGDVSGGVSVVVHGHPKQNRISASGGAEIDTVD